VIAEKNPLRKLVGASVLSAAGSLPLQILPFLVLTLVAEGRVSVFFAGWIGSAFLTGMLFSVLLLPLMGVSRLSRWHALGSSGAIIVALLFSAEGTWLPMLLALWFVVGVACGGLQFLGARAAVAAPHPPQAFALRLAITLLTAAAVIVALAHFHGQHYAAVVNLLCLVFGLSAGIGVLLYRDSGDAGPLSGLPAPGIEAPSARSGGWVGLAVVFAFFVGQPGFWAYAMQSASQRGLDLRDAALVIAASKVMSALVLLYGSRKDCQWGGTPGLLVLGCGVGGGILLMTYSAAVTTFFLGFLFWELALNVLSARLQGIVVQASPYHAGAWITGTIFLGAAAGPAVHGAAIGAGITLAFISYAALSGLLPFFWAWSRKRVA
jgi:hypothetical protein